MTEKELEALNHILAYVDHADKMSWDGLIDEHGTIQYDSITLRDWLNYQIDMSSDAAISNDAKRAAKASYSKEKN